MTLLTSDSRQSVAVKTILSTVIGVAVLIAGASAFAYLASFKQPPAARERVARTYNVEVFKVQRSDLQEIVSSFGTARADREVVLSAQVAGEVLDVHPDLRVGQFVRQPEKVRNWRSGQTVDYFGDLLVQIDPQPYQEKVVQAKNRLAEDDAELARLNQEENNNARMLAKVTKDFATFEEEFKRIELLRKTNAVSKSQLTRALLELRQYEESKIKHENDKRLFPVRFGLLSRRRATHQTELQLAQLDLRHAEIRPAFSGTLSEVMVEKGQYVRVGDGLVRLTDISVVEIPVPVTLGDYAKLKPLVRAGRHPSVMLAENATAPPRWTGCMVRVAPEADQLTRTINVYVRIENPAQEVPLLPGTFVHARIDGPVLRQTLVVPRDAIIDGKLFVASEGRAVERRVVVRKTLQSLAIVESGVEPGDAVILTNLDIIHDGARVDVQSHHVLADELQRQRTPVVREARSPDVTGGNDCAR